MSEEITKEYQSIIDQTALVVKMDTYGYITYVNDNFYIASGYDKEELISNSITILHDETYTKAMYDDMLDTMLSSQSWHGVLRYKTKANEPYYLRLTVYPILDKDDKLKEFICVAYEITESILQERDKNKKIISTKTNFVQKSKDKEAIIQKELNDTKTQLAKALELVEYFKTQNKELISKSEHQKYENDIDKISRQNEQLRVELRKAENSVKSLQLDSVRKEKEFAEKYNNLQAKNNDLSTRNEALHNEVKKAKHDIQKLVTMMNNAKKPKKTTIGDLLPTYKDKEKDEVMKKSALKALFEE